LNEFLRKTGQGAGNTSLAYYGSYVFFEKITIRDGKAKTKTSVEKENLYDGREFFGKKGMDAKHRSGEYF
jgi:hypothetical protein